MIFTVLVEQFIESSTLFKTENTDEYTKAVSQALSKQTVGKSLY